jgi:hypothetical protein
MNDKKIRKEAEKKSLLSRIMSMGARNKAAKAKKESYLSDDKRKQFKKAYRNK